MRSIKTAVIMALILVLSLSAAQSPNLPTYALTYKEGQTEEEGLITGIVKENNPSLGYITLYFQDGSGADPGAFEKLVSTRNFTYAYEIPVLRDGYTVGIEEIQPGDQVFLKLDEEGYIEKLSAKSFYQPVYGTVHLKKPSWLVIRKEDGAFVNYPLSAGIPIYKNDRPCGIDDILPGDRVKILVQTDGANIDIASIDIEKVSKPITGIYRGNAEFFDVMQNSLAVSGVQEFINGKWENSPIRGIQRFSYSKDYTARPPRRVSGTVYIATQKAPDGTDKIVAAAYRSNPGYETTIKDNLLTLADGGSLELENTSALINVDKDTIAVKDGRLVDVSALGVLDTLRISMEKSLYGNSYLANVLVCDTVIHNGPIIYRGRIKSVDPTKSITVESFAQLSGISWTVTNTPKTFDIDISSSRLLLDDGVGNMRNLDSSFINQSVYIVAEGTKIKLVSTAPYALNPVSGRVVSLAGGSYDSSGTVLTEPTSIRLGKVMTYDIDNHIWNAGQDMDITIPANAVVLKRGEIGGASLIKPGDEIRIIRHAQSLNGILILCD